MPECWPFVITPMPKSPECIKTDGADENELMIRRVWIHLMKRTTNNELTASAKKKSSIARTGHATGEKKYMSFVIDLMSMPEKPGPTKL
jgi:hypothetical protein